MTESRDRLREIWEEQFDFLVRMDPGFDRMTLGDRLTVTKEYILHAQTELVELLNETTWKTWLHSPQLEPSVDGLIEEAVDVFKFVLNVMLTWDVSSDKFFEVFRRKTEVNVNRHLQSLQLSRIRALARRGGRPHVAVLDLDGVLAAYPEHWLDYIFSATGIRVTSDAFSLLAGAVGPALSRERYATLKHEYRTTGMEVAVPPLPHAVEFTQDLRAMGYVVVIVSARPVDRYKRLYSDTVRWLKEHGFAYDAILWEPYNKEDKVIAELPEVAFACDDDPANVEKLSKAKIRAYLLDRPYNRGIVLDGASRVSGFGELLGIITTSVGMEAESDERRAGAGR